ncbi:hypothetical protein HYPSUDRAFT_49350 [Hypholoma sublateritium FD-334 SS-4]|uniref:F-box domain-containing protein n=1 Tax=Hypholoma sublateritium (strain FD-334 SS-4) TaxID=945553 RepID=A0A0D2N4Z2_HYPSF|nr:hypothetical protein HYPSUDRAFT_49350 [Hypholoma sublateritium FD-334 SS-4]
MDHTALSSNLVLETLPKTNRPPTDQERAIIQESMSPASEKLKAVEVQISDAIAHIQALKLQIEETENKLRRLCQEEAAILETSANHRRVLSTVRNLPEDVLREICIACVDSEVNVPALFYGDTPLPYRLAQISSGMRHIALTTPLIWASMNIYMDYDCDPLDYTQVCSILASRANRWFERAGGMALTVSITDTTYSYARFQDVQADSSNILFNTLFSYSTCWKRFRFESSCRDELAFPPIIDIRRVSAALSAADLPLLESITLRCECGISMFRNSPIFSIPTLRYLTLDTQWDVWPDGAVISDRREEVSSFDEIARMLRQTKRLVFCDIALAPGSMDSLGEINLPFLEMLRVDDHTFHEAARDLSIFDLINAPILATLRIRAALLDASLANFFERSPGIRVLSISQWKVEEILADITELLCHCPSLSSLNLEPRELWDTVDQPSDANRFLRAFVEDAGAGVTCPRLQSFIYKGNISFSLQTLRQFLEAKQHGTDPLSALLPWKRVFINVGRVDDSEIEKTRDLVSQKQAAGIDIHVYT